MCVGKVLCATRLGSWVLRKHIAGAGGNEVPGGCLFAVGREFSTLVPKAPRSHRRRIIREAVGNAGSVAEATIHVPGVAGPKAAGAAPGGRGGARALPPASAGDLRAVWRWAARSGHHHEQEKRSSAHGEPIAASMQAVQAARTISAQVRVADQTLGAALPSALAGCAPDQLIQKLLPRGETCCVDVVSLWQLPVTTLEHQKQYLLAHSC